MKRVISTREVQIRQFALRSFVPFVFGATNELVKRAESRMRRTAAIQRHVKGKGIEIGAAASPSMVPLGCHVTYVDKYPLEVLAADPELAGLNIVRPAILASAEMLEGIGAASQDFVLAFSMIEHAQCTAAYARELVSGDASGWEHRVERARQGSLWTRP